MRKGNIIVGIIVFCAATAGFAPAQTDEVSILNKYKTLEPRVEKARSYFLAEKYARCESEAAACLESLAEHHGAHFFLAQVLYQRGEFERALEHALAAKSGFLHLQEIGKRLKQQKLEKQLDDKLDLAERLEDWNAALAQTVCQKAVYQGASMATEDKLNKASNYSDSIASNVDRQVPAEYDYFHGNCLFRLKRYPEAEAQYKAAIGVEPRHANAYNNLVNLLYVQKRFEEARALLAQAGANQVDILPGLKKAVLNAPGK